MGFISMQASAQNSCQPPVYYFNSLSVVNGNGGVNSTYRFNSVLSGIDALVTVIKAQNAQMNNANMDNASGYALAWQPFVTFPANRNNSSDSSYLEYQITFVASGTTTPVTQNCMALGIVDLDGSGSGSAYREMIKISLPGTPTGIDNSSISVYQDKHWVLFKSGISQFNNIDTVHSAAMGQMNFPSGVSSFRIRVGIVGPVSGGTQRQFSLYFKSFAALTVPLPVYLSDFKAVSNDAGLNIGWISTHESNFSHFELYRSLDGYIFEPVQTLAGKGSYNSISHYKVLDETLPAFHAGSVYYKLKMTDLDAQWVWSHTIKSADRELILGGNVFNVFPNPVSDQLGISSGAMGTISNVCITDACGLIVLEQSFGADSEQQVLLVADLPAGVYTIHISDADGLTEKKRFVKY